MAAPPSTAPPIASARATPAPAAHRHATGARPARTGAPGARAARRLLRSPLVDLLLGPHGVDRYLELISPGLTVADARARIVRVRRQTARSVTLTLTPNAAFRGVRAGQFLTVGVELDGVRRTRTYSPTGSEHDRAGTLELTITEHPGGRVSPELVTAARPGAYVHLGPAQGTFVLPTRRPQRLALISGGSGITPVLAMLRTLYDEGLAAPVLFSHYARTEHDWLYADETRTLAARWPALEVRYRATRGPGAERLTPAAFGTAAPDAGSWAAVCGPRSLIDAARELWAARGGDPAQLLTESFEPPTLALTGAAAEGTVRFTKSNRRAPIADGTLLEQAEAAGLTPAFGCRMGICRTCTCRKHAGTVRNLVTGAVSAEEDEDIQLCVSVPAGDVALAL